MTGRGAVNSLARTGAFGPHGAQAEVTRARLGRKLGEAVSTSHNAFARKALRG